MSSGLAEVYHTIAQAIADCLEEPWTSASIRASLEEDVAEFGFKYHRVGELVARDFAWQIDPQIDVIYSSFESIRASMLKEGERPWRTAIFELKPDGKFTINFLYDM